MFCQNDKCSVHPLEINVTGSQLTSVLKMVREEVGDIHFLPFPIADCNKHTMDVHCPLLSESPTNIILFPLNFSSISVPFHLLDHESMHCSAFFFVERSIIQHFFLLLIEYGSQFPCQKTGNSPHTYIMELQTLANDSISSYSTEC